MSDTSSSKVQRVWFNAKSN